MKKLYVHFTDKEKKLLKNILKNSKNKEITIISHAKERMVQKHISPRDIAECLKDFEVIELHQRNSWDTRVLLRGKAKDRYNRNTCISLSLVTFSIITAYKNSATDNHYTLQSENYENASVEYLLEELAK